MVDSHPRLVVGVIGSTGIQGGSVVHALLHTDNYTVHAFTRNASSDAAKQLQQQGCKVIEIDVNNLDSVKRGFHGCDAVYCVTSSFDDDIVNNREQEVVQGKNMVDAAIANKVQYIVWSTLPDSRQLSHNEYTDIKHTYQKDDVRLYALEQCKQQPTTEPLFILCCSYFQNYCERFGLHNVDGQAVFKLPSSDACKLDCCDVSQLGLLFVALLQKADKYAGQTVALYGERITPQQLAEAFQSTYGIPSRFETVTRDQFVSMGTKDSRQAELYTMFQYYDKYGLLGTPQAYDTTIARQLVPELHDYKAYLQAHKDDILNKAKLQQ